MGGFVLVINAGSSSLKFCTFHGSTDENWSMEVRGQIEGIGKAPRFSARDFNGTSIADHEVPVRNGSETIEALASWLRTKYHDVHLLGIGHRVVHGGPRFKGPIRLNPQVVDQLREFIPLAPLHQPQNLAFIEAAFDRLPDVPQVACFDTSFHHGRPTVAELVPVPRDLRQSGIQRYGFHGLSYEYIASVLTEVVPDLANGRVIVAHLGNGASMCAMKAGKSIDNTHGLTTLDGLCMGTRPGALDPGVVLHLLQGLNFTAKDVETLLYKRSGLLGISGISSDMRDLESSRDPDARLAVDYFVYRAAKEIGALTAVLGGIDGLVFTAGIGENSVGIRQRICNASSWLGIEIDEAANSTHQGTISTSRSKVSVRVIRTNEELMIARHTGEVLGLAKAAR